MNQGTNKHKIKAIIFDCDGTLVDSEEHHFFAWREVIKEFRAPFTPEEELSFFGKPDFAIAQMVCKKIDRNIVDHILMKKNSYIAKFVQNGVRPIVGTVNFARSIFAEKDKLGLKLAVASASAKSEILFNLKNVGLSTMFELVLSGKDDLFDYNDPDEVNKPKPYIYLHAAKLLGVSPAECVAIEDSVTGVSSAVQAGCFTVAVPNFYSKHQDLSRANLKIDSLESYSPDNFLKMVLSEAFVNKKS